MNRLRSMLGPAVAVLLTATAWVVLPGGLTQPAAAAACTGNSGVTVVVDYNELGGIQAGCANGSGGKSASAAFAEANFTLSFVRDDPANGFVCRVAGLPTGSVCGNTPPADAYWGLWYSDGTSGTWTYATRGVNQLKVPNGSFVAFAWHQGGGRAEAPDVAPRRSTPESPKPTKKPTTNPTTKPTKKPTTRPASPTSTPTSAPSSSDAEKSESTGPSGSPSASESPSDEATDSSESASPSDDSSTDLPTVDDITEGPPESGTVENADDGGADDGLPMWIPFVAVVVIVAAGAAVVVRRRLG
ncbi:hypothetical protein [Nocardioides alcanivorans]|uniref:hypothetical protein n=1 Tax=Nocardioides alcanivorans TaxID=2897352 RepID=UPI001F1F1291|nr:hypothetical protein [Nocardioides alcanivorans]